jgi:toxin FitB
MTIFEVELGVRLLDRRDRLQAAPLRQWIDSVLRPSFRSRLLPVDEPVAIAGAGLHVPDSRAARGALIAATAIVHGLTVATRNIRDFQGLPVALVDPWRAA